MVRTIQLVAYGINMFYNGLAKIIATAVHMTLLLRQGYNLVTFD